MGKMCKNNVKKDKCASWLWNKSTRQSRWILEGDLRTCIGLSRNKIGNVYPNRCFESDDHHKKEGETL